MGLRRECQACSGPTSRPTASLPPGRSGWGGTGDRVEVGTICSFVIHWQTVCWVEVLCWAKWVQGQRKLPSNHGAWARDEEKERLGLLGSTQKPGR